MLLTHILNRRLSSSDMGRFLLTLTLLTGLTVCPASDAQTREVQIGLNGHFRLGAWTPIKIRGVQESPAVLRCSDSTGLLADYPLERAGDELVGSVQIANPDARCVILAGEPPKKIAAFVPNQIGQSHRVSERLWLVTGDVSGFDLAAERYNEVAEEFDRAVVISGTLADEWTGRQRSDALAVANVVVVNEQVSDASSDALRDWVGRGGHLLHVGGLSDAEEGAVLEWVTVQLAGPASFRDLNALETAVPAGRGLRLSGFMNGVRLDVEEGIVPIDSTYGPILTRSPFGFGTVSVFALDLTHAVFQRWSSLGSLCLLLTGEAPETVSKRGGADRLTTSGVSEFETQLMSVVDAAIGPGRERPDQWSIMGRLIIYAIAIGAIDFLLVHYLLRKPQLTWFTMPLWALVVFAVVAFEDTQTDPDKTTGRQSIRTLTVIDHDVASGVVRASAMSSVASADRTRLAVNLCEQPFAESTSDPLQLFKDEARIGWLAPPEATFGGLYRSATISNDALSYESDASRNHFSRVPFEPRGTRLFQTAWSGTIDGSESDSDVLASISLQLSGTRPVGRIEHNFPGTISSWALAVGRNFVQPMEPAPLEPGKPFEVTIENCRSQSLRDRMIGMRRTQVFDGSRSKQKKNESNTRLRTIAERQEYDPTSLNHAEALLTATFYDRAGGIDYTGIRNSGSPQGLDLSDRLGFDRVVFFGILDKAVNAVELEDGTRVDDEESYTYVRIVAPLQDDSDTNE